MENFKQNTSDSPTDQETTKQRTDSTIDSVAQVDKPQRFTSDKEENGTLVFSLISMIITMVGLGIFALPYAFACSGVLFGSFLVILCGILTDVGLVALVRVQKLSGGDCYEDVADFYFGKIGRWVVYFLVNLDLLMACAQQLTPYSQYTAEVIQDWSNCDWSANQTIWKTKDDESLEADYRYCDGWNKWTITIIPLVVTFPFLLKKTVDSLKWASFVSVTCLIVSIFIFFYYYVSGDYVKSVGKDRYSATSPFPWHKTAKLGIPSDTITAFDAVGIIVFAYVCFFQILLLYRELAKKENIYPVIHGATLGFAMPVYLLVGICGYGLFGEQLLVNYQPAGMVFGMFPKDYVIAQVAIFAIGLTATFKIAIFANPFRDAILVGLNNVLAQVKPGLSIKDNMLYRVPMALFICGIAYIISIAVPLSIIMQTAGSVTGASLNGYIVGFLLFAYIKMYGVSQLDKDSVTQNRLISCGIVSRKIWKTLTRKMKKSYIVAWILIVYGILGTTIGMTPVIAFKLFDHEPPYACMEKTPFCIKNYKERFLTVDTNVTEVVNYTSE